MGETRARKTGKKVTKAVVAQPQQRKHHEVQSEVQIPRHDETLSQPLSVLTTPRLRGPRYIAEQPCTEDKPSSEHTELKTATSTEDDPECYVEIRTTAAKGMAVFTTRKVPSGLLVLCETPLIRLTQAEEDLAKDTASSFSSSSQADSTCVVDKRLSSLPRATQKAYLRLFDSHKSGFSVAKSIYYSNCYNLSGRNLPSRTSSGGSCIGLMASRINHSCVPNVQFSFDEATNTMLFHTIKPIAKGKEVLSVYDTVYEIRAQRQQKQRLYYGFQCDCDACEWKTEFWSRSDDRRRGMIECRKAVRECEKIYDRSKTVTGEDENERLESNFYCSTTIGSSSTVSDAIAALERLEELLIKEGLVGLPLADCYRSVSKWATRKGDPSLEERARNKELETGRRCFGEQSPRVQHIRAVMSTKKDVECVK